ncbi:BCTnown [Vibrio neptunius]|uniref:hypothetical protein n=1 Tax=Vibrio neptunius TaxID=170651 RepID=UPI001C5CA346|nr:hypothetical protein [Vibrio neptunius]QXX05633.1 hypothetical protein KW548_10455 [Vibrio neptunius]
MILGYVTCTAPGCNEPMEVSQRSKYLKGRCNACECTEQRANTNTQHYLSQYMPLEALNQVHELQPEGTSEQQTAAEVQPEPSNVPTPNASDTPQEDKKNASDKDSGGGWVFASIGAFLGYGLGKFISNVRFA